MRTLLYGVALSLMGAAFLPLPLLGWARALLGFSGIGLWSALQWWGPGGEPSSDPERKPKPRLRGDLGLRGTPRLSGTDPLDAIWGTQASFPTAPEDVGFDNAHHLVIHDDDDDGAIT
ncbi:MAG: hypothetical protein H6738_20070 [Alphaproteobacteria bacterium]|nr:hypothetical protein [Alphaproteobacteria bacterium]MCB9699089.1 hypothetical protein [Alphaproteobacteria bacterium]